MNDLELYKVTLAVAIYDYCSFKGKSSVDIFVVLTETHQIDGPIDLLLGQQLE